MLLGRDDVQPSALHELALEDDAVLLVDALVGHERNEHVLPEAVHGDLGGLYRLAEHDGALREEQVDAVVNLVAQVGAQARDGLLGLRAAQDGARARVVVHAHQCGRHVAVAELGGEVHVVVEPALRLGQRAEARGRLADVAKGELLHIDQLQHVRILALDVGEGHGFHARVKLGTDGVHDQNALVHYQERAH